MRSSTKQIVTIGVCVRNSEARIKEVINSIANQDFPREQMEIIFVDDGSKDRTLSIILSTIPKIDSQTRIFSIEWKGLGQARNIVVDNASSDYIIWVDGDMTLSRDFVRKQVEFMEKELEVGIAKGKYGGTPSKNLAAYLENIVWRVVDHKDEGSALPGTGGSIFRVRAIRQAGGFDNQFTGAGEDIEAVYRVRESGWQISKTKAKFFEDHKTSWKALWREKLWKGYGLHMVFHKHHNFDRLYEMAPPFGFLAGVFNSLIAYRLTRQKKVFLLPFHSIFVKTALCIGFIKSHLNSYGHPK